MTGSPCLLGLHSRGGGEDGLVGAVERVEVDVFDGQCLLVKFRTSCGLLCGLRERVEQWVDDFLREPFAG